ncbi:TPA: hypothetical protein KNN56_001687 [Clostridioides difficile]|nr:hypothetical protein [Clostridioides difficile]ELX4576066.1 hypothetical protein [Clostridioides difficile]MBH6986662.1 hypothetical protein [Clostridioides difficile]MBH7139417.1 hypothetical protein [Clostridioides difficile]MBY1993376.1 hypothetical protein [Clostridioides difficile]MBY2145739.1 hypothetical protein [Clostridioides difficile]
MQVLVVIFISLLALSMIVSFALAVTAKKSDERLRTICLHLEQKER